MPKICDGISEIAQNYDHFIIDIWGVLHDGREAYAGTREALLFLKAQNKQVLLLSNSPNRSARVVEKVLEPMGFTNAHYDHILTSGEAAHTHMLERYNNTKVYTFWNEEEPSTFENINLHRSYNIQEADFIYGSLLPLDANAQSYTPILEQAAALKLPLVCGNPDRVVGHGDTLHVCVGTLADMYETLGGDVTWIGKPHTPVYKQAWHMLGQPDKSKILAIGDSLQTDIAGANAFGCDAAWNAIGIHWDEIQTNNHIDKAKVTQALQGYATPKALMHGFKV